MLDGDFNFQLPNGTMGSVYQRVGYKMLENKTSEPDYDPFDVSVCFGVGQYIHITDGTPYASIDHSLLRARIRLALSQAANLPATRLECK